MRWTQWTKTKRTNTAHSTYINILCIYVCMYMTYICQHEYYYYTVHIRYSPAILPSTAPVIESPVTFDDCGHLQQVKQMTRIQRSWPLPSMFLLPGRLPECVFAILSSLNTGAKRNVNLNSECNTGKYPRKRGGIGDCKVGKYRNPTGKILMRDYRRTQCTY